MKNELTAKRLQLAMSFSNIKAQELADRSGLNKASISQYINGTHAPPNISAGKMASILNVNPVWLMGFDVPMAINTDQSKDLNSDEVALLADYNRLNQTGKAKTREYISDLLDNEKYTRNESELPDSERERLA